MWRNRLFRPLRRFLIVMLRGGEVTEVRPNYSVSRISWAENYSESREPTQLGIIMSGCDGKSIKVFGIIHLAGSAFVPEQLASQPAQQHAKGLLFMQWSHKRNVSGTDGHLQYYYVVAVKRFNLLCSNMWHFVLLTLRSVTWTLSSTQPWVTLCN